MKTIADYFTDWESSAFGYGYGTGEPHTLAALKQFLALVPDKGSYDYEVLEAELTPTVAWLMINLLCHEDMLEYGCSPRVAWLTTCGKRLKEFVDARSVDELEELTSRIAGEDDWFPCGRDYCNCGQQSDSSKGCQNNPFWREKAQCPQQGAQ